MHKLVKAYQTENGIGIAGLGFVLIRPVSLA
jgi:hypothetical protein